VSGKTERDCSAEKADLLLPATDVGVIYIQKGVELLVLEFDISGSAGEYSDSPLFGAGAEPFSLSTGWFSVVVAILFALFVYFLERTATLPFGRESNSVLLRRTSFRASLTPSSTAFFARKFIQDYAFAAGIILFTGFVHM
jgi:boron transporter